VLRALLRDSPESLDARAEGMGGATPLHLAACRGSDGEEVARVLLDAGASPSLEMARGVNAAHLAAWSGAPALLGRLLASDGSLLDLATESGLHVLDSAAIGGYPECVEAALAAGGRAGAAVPALHGASLGASDDSVRMLLAGCPDALHELSDAAGWTALQAAAAAGSLIGVRALLAAGADVHAVSGDGMSALDLACACGHADVTDALIDEGGAGVGGESGVAGYAPPLLCAIISGDVETIQTLASRGLLGAATPVEAYEVEAVVGWLHGVEAAEEVHALGL